MIDKKTPDFNEQELHAYVDGQISDDKILLIENWLKTNPDEAKKVVQWRLQNDAIRELILNCDTEGDDDVVVNDRDALLIASLANKHAKRQPIFKISRMMVAAVLPLVLFGAIVGGMLTFNATKPIVNKSYAQNLSDVSRFSYVVYSGEIKHPIEVGIDEKDHLIAWLGKRINKKMTLPNLADQGFKLLGGRVLPLNGQASAMLMYEDDNGERLTLIIGQSGAEDALSFKYSEFEDVQTYHWINQKYGYAISGKTKREKMELVAQEIYRQS